MQELIPAVWDDLDYKRDGTKTAAAENLTVGYKGVWVELDLTAVHAKELLELLTPYLQAGRKPDRKPAAASPQAPGRRIDLGRRAYFKGLRDWADDHGFSYLTPGGQVYYYSLEEAYAAFLAGEPESVWRPLYEKGLNAKREKGEA